MAGRKTKVRIGRLVVETGRDADGREVARAIETELRRLAAEPRGGGSSARGRIEAEDQAIDVPTGTPAHEIGNTVARTIWQTARKEERR